MSAFSLRDVYKTYRDAQGNIINALAGVTFDAPRDAITCLVGPTGSGKSTILRLLASLDTPDQGELCAPDEVGYLTQQHTLLPWLTLSDNIALPLEAKGMARAERIRRAHELCVSLGLADAAGRYPHELSGGMRQRGAIGRLMASGAMHWLLDEPFSSLDGVTQRQLQGMLMDIARARGISVLMVTHQLDEAASLADRVVVLASAPGRVSEVIELDGGSRERLSAEFGHTVEGIRKALERAMVA